MLSFTLHNKFKSEQHPTTTTMLLLRNLGDSGGSTTSHYAKLPKTHPFIIIMASDSAVADLIRTHNSKFTQLWVGWLAKIKSAYFLFILPWLVSITSEPSKGYCSRHYQATYSSTTSLYCNPEQSSRCQP